MLIVERLNKTPVNENRTVYNWAASIAHACSDFKKKRNSTKKQAQISHLATNLKPHYNNTLRTYLTQREDILQQNNSPLKASKQKFTANSIAIFNPKLNTEATKLKRLIHWIGEKTWVQKPITNPFHCEFFRICCVWCSELFTEKKSIKRKFFFFSTFFTWDKNCATKNCVLSVNQHSSKQVVNIFCSLKIILQVSALKSSIQLNTSRN